jgi:hypothetical protein
VLYALKTVGVAMSEMNDTDLNVSKELMHGGFSPEKSLALRNFGIHVEAQFHITSTIIIQPVAHGACIQKRARLS